MSWILFNVTLAPLLQGSPVDPSKPNFSPYQLAPSLLGRFAEDFCESLSSLSVPHPTPFPPWSKSQHYRSTSCCWHWLKQYSHGFTHKWLQCSCMMLPTCNNRPTSSQPVWRVSRSPRVAEVMADLDGVSESRHLHSTQANFSLQTLDILRVLLSASFSSLGMNFESLSLNVNRDSLSPSFRNVKEFLI